MKYFISLFMYVDPIVFAESAELKEKGYRTSKHYGACKSPSMSKRKR